MEKDLDRVMDDIIASENVTGCVFADHLGLCLGVKGLATTESAGMIVAVAEQAAKLEPHLSPPTVLLENDSRSCIIQRSGTITGAIFKDIST